MEDAFAAGKAEAFGGRQRHHESPAVPCLPRLMHVRDEQSNHHVAHSGEMNSRDGHGNDGEHGERREDADVGPNVLLDIRV